MITIINPTWMLELEKKLDVNSTITIEEVGKYSKLIFLHNQGLSGEVEIQDFPCLEEVCLEWNDIEKLGFDEVSKANLKVLKLTGNKFRKLEDCISYVDVGNLTHLILSDNYLDVDLNYFQGFSFVELDLSNRENNKREFKNFVSGKNKILLSLLIKSIESLKIDNTDTINQVEQQEQQEEFQQSPLNEDGEASKIVPTASFLVAILNFFKMIWEKIKNFFSKFKWISNLVKRFNNLSGWKKVLLVFPIGLITGSATLILYGVKMALSSL